MMCFKCKHTKVVNDIWTQALFHEVSYDQLGNNQQNTDYVS